MVDSNNTIWAFLKKTEAIVSISTQATNWLYTFKTNFNS